MFYYSNYLVWKELKCMKNPYVVVGNFTPDTTARGLSDRLNITVCSRYTGRTYKKHHVIFDRKKLYII